MRRSVLALVGLLASTGFALAQSNWNQSQGGNYTHHNGSMNGEPFNGTQSRLGNYTYGNSNVGGQTTNCTSSHLGNYRYTNCN